MKGCKAAQPVVQRYRATGGTGQVSCADLQEFGDTSVWFTPNSSSISVTGPPDFWYQLWPNIATFEPWLLNMTVSAWCNPKK